MDQPILDLNGKVALVTGSAQGLGAEIATTLARQGARVIVSDVLEDLGRTTARAIQGAQFVKHDVVSEPDWQRVVQFAVETHGRLDLVVNNAGIEAFSLLENLTVEQFQRVQKVNLEGTFLGTKWAIRVMKPGGSSGHGGSIINISSLAGIVGTFGLSAYCAAKGGVRLLTKAAAIECAHLGYGIRVNSIHPAVVEGGMGKSVVKSLVDSGLAPDEHVAESLLASTHPMGFGKPKDVADAVCFVASSRWMNGAELVLDGGASAQ
ncbi:SDR family NAD(P)-dependent oxidoreductase [Burkholderia lata]|uniref:SDR family NAD(P)-dependent oxidoreductase n=1 Tax=Burkholderia lata (strain ATCC 17760 / DSM 23089 / LMG 22485 / NCIMB 9086 / R18194 / 383) TaxID=482957 RepID=UPI0015843DA1|nr:SDR family NAD(P)-dependent oxidoreductase [Burkholderia lata]